MNRIKLTRIVIFYGTVFFTGIVFTQCKMKFRTPDRTAKEKFEAAGVTLFTETVDATGYRLHYAKTGNDTLPTLFFVHGTPGSWMKFGKYLQDKDLLKKYRMVSVDRPGFGYSQFGDARNLEQQSAIISVLLLQLKNGKPIYGIGRSFGGPLVVRLAADNPGLFSGLVLLAAALDPATEKKYPWRPIFFKSPLNYFIPGAWRTSNEELSYLINDLKELTKLAPSITCPVYIMHGDADGMVPVSNATYGKKILVNAKPVYLSIIPGAHHHIPDDNYDLVKDVLLKLHHDAPAN
jgi:pimeloyl-ACP methyl ester carboxylesterase